MTYRVLWFSRERYRSNSGPGGRFYASVPLTKGGTGLSLQTYNFSMTTSGRRWHIGFTFGKNAEVADSAMTPGHATGPLRNPRWNEDKVPSMVMNFLYRMDLLHRLDFPIFRTEHHKKTSAVIHRGSKTMSFKNDQARDDLRVPNQHSLTFHCKKIEMADLCAYSSKRSFLVDSQTRSRSSKHPDQGSSFQGPPASTFHRPHTTMMPLFHRRFGTAGCHQLQQRLDRRRAVRLTADESWTTDFLSLDDIIRAIAILVWLLFLRAAAGNCSRWKSTKPFARSSNSKSSRDRRQRDFPLLRLSKRRSIGSLGNPSFILAFCPF
jgi:hypothetical protein